MDIVYYANVYQEEDGRQYLGSFWLDKQQAIDVGSVGRPAIYRLKITLNRPRRLHS